MAQRRACEVCWTPPGYRRKIIRQRRHRVEVTVWEDLAVRHISAWYQSTFQAQPNPHSSALCASALCSSCASLQQVVYSRFRTMVDTGDVHSARFDDSSKRVYFELRPDVVKKALAQQDKLATWPEGAHSLPQVEGTGGHRL